MLNNLKRPIESYSRKWLAIISIIAASGVAGIILVLAQLEPGQIRYRAEFAQAASIVPGNQVTVAGIQVGTVTGLQLAGDRIIIDFKVDRAVHVDDASRAAIKLTTLLGTRYLELSPAGHRELKDHTISLANTQVPYDLQQTLADATTTFEQVDADRVAQSMGTLSKALTGLPEALPQTLQNLQSLSSVIADRRDQIRTLLASTDNLTTVIRNQKAALGSLILKGRDLLAELAQRRAAVERLFANATALVDKSKSILEDEPKINSLLTDLAGVMQKVHKNDALLRNIFQITPVALRNLANASGSAMGVDLNFPMAGLVDSWMCALSARSKEWGFAQYFQDCKPVPDPYPGWPPPDPLGRGFPGFPPDAVTTDMPGPQPANAGNSTASPSNPAPAPPSEGSSKQ